MDVKLKFWGGVCFGNNVTGSCYQLFTNTSGHVTNDLIDSGLWQGKFSECYERNRFIAENLIASQIDHIINTHGHVDHCGILPLLCRNGFENRILCTEANASLLPISLLDSAKIQEEEYSYRSKKLKRIDRDVARKKREKNQEKTKYGPLFTTDDAESAIKSIKNSGFEYFQWIKLEKNIHLKFYPSGHVLGGAICVLRISRPKAEKPIYLGFSGDLGRKDGIILPSPEIIEEPINYWFIESTYGDSIHPEREDEIKKLMSVIINTNKKKGTIIIPSYALEKTQELIYILSSSMENGLIPKIPIYLDAPMATKITAVYSSRWGTPLFKDQEKLKINFNPFSFEENPYLNAIEDSEQSARLSKGWDPYNRPHIVIAGSGTGDAGRVRNHYRENLSKRNTTICIIGYNPVDSLNRKLQEIVEGQRERKVRMNEQDIIVNADIVLFKSLSAHADKKYLIEYTREIFKPDGYPDHKIFIVHGEKNKAEFFRECLIDSMMNHPVKEDWRNKIIIPKLYETITLYKR